MAPGDAGAGAFEGRIFGGYRIGQPIASGGMATVFMARKTGPGRFAHTAALKIIHPHLARDRELVEMFTDEARLASCVNHPNVCRVLDFGEVEGTFFLTMEYVRGETWANVLAAFSAHREARLRLLPLTAHVLAQACEGLHAIHEAVDMDGRPLRIVHRDVAPQNLLIAYDGSIRLLDFGIASAEGRAHTSGSEVVRGRYPYMAPEQMRGLDVDRRADVWSLGVILREAISGLNPFARENQIATMLAVTQDPVPAWPGHVPLMLREIADRALTRDPDERFPDARQLGNALTHYLKTQTEPALGAELSHFMRILFAAEIAKSRAALRQLAGDDLNSDVFSSTFPSAIAPRDTDSCLTAPTRVKPLLERADARFAFMRKRVPFLLGAGVMFIVSLAGSWYLARQTSAPSRSAVRESSGPLLAPAEPTPAKAVAGNAVAVPAVEAPAAGALSEAPAGARTEKVESSTTANARPLAEGVGQAREGSARARHEREAQNDPARPAEEAGEGTLVIGATQGWAEVFADGQRLGTTPLRTQLPSGTRALEVRPYGAGSPRRMSVEIKPGEISKLRLDL
jgi:serine/threonine-protein kinase